MKIKSLFAWFDFWVGVYWDVPQRRLFIFPIPMFGVVIDFWETHEFTLWLDGIRYERFDDYLLWYSTVCDDALYGWQNGQAYLSFSRRAVNRQEAIRSAREHDEMGFGVRVSGVSDD